MQYRFQASGYSGGWTNWGADTVRDLQAGATAALAAAGFRVVALTVDADQWDASARVFSNSFPYRLTATVETTQPAAVAFPLFTRTIQDVTGFAAVVSNLTAGDPAQPSPATDPIGGLFGDLNTSLALVAVVAVAAAVVFVRLK